MAAAGRAAAAVERGWGWWGGARAKRATSERGDGAAAGRAAAAVERGWGWWGGVRAKRATSERGDGAAAGRAPQQSSAGGAGGEGSERSEPQASAEAERPQDASPQQSSAGGAGGEGGSGRELKVANATPPRSTPSRQGALRRRRRLLGSVAHGSLTPLTPPRLLPTDPRCRFVAEITRAGRGPSRPALIALKTRQRQPRKRRP